MKFNSIKNWFVSNGPVLIGWGLFVAGQSLSKAWSLVTAVSLVCLAVARGLP